MLAVIKDLVLVSVQTLSRWPCLLHTSLSIGRGRKRTHTAVRKRVGDVDPGAVVYHSRGGGDYSANRQKRNARRFLTLLKQYSNEVENQCIYRQIKVKNFKINI